MEACGWLSVKEMVEYHSTLTLWKIITFKVPCQLYDEFTIEHDGRISTEEARLKTTASYWRNRVTVSWNALPD